MNAQLDRSEPVSLTSELRRAPASDLRLSPEAAQQIRAEVGKAGGREVCFIARVGPDGVLVEPRAVARGNDAAVLAAARDADEGSVMIHNHPSGDPTPSPEDVLVTRETRMSGEMMDIEVLDHVIIGSNGYVSMKEKGLGFS